MHTIFYENLFEGHMKFRKTYEKWPHIRDADYGKAKRVRLLNMCVIVFLPRFRGVKGNAGLLWGVPVRGN